MSEIRIKITQNAKCYDEWELEPHVAKILNGKHLIGPNPSVLDAICQDLLEMLFCFTKLPYRYEHNSKGHFFVIEESILTNENTKGIFGTEAIIYERVSFLD